MKTKPKHLRHFYDFLLTVAILAIATILCTLLRRLDDGSGYVNLIFVLAVACISRWTEGFFWGTFSSVSAVLFVNFVFTYPYWAFNFTITGYPLTFLAMLTVSIMISAMNTQIKKQEKLRLETEKEAVRANLLRAMSHDIRTPLTSIVGNTAAILDNEDSFSPEQKRRLLEDVNEDAQWLIRMVENLLSITRMSGGQAKIAGRDDVLHCWKSTGHGAEDTAQALQNSCNIAFAEIGIKLGGEALYNYVEAFGLLEKTGMIGGASATAGAGTIATGSRWQQEDGYEDSPEKLVEDMMANGHQKNDRATVELFSRIIGPSFDWLVSDEGAAVPYVRPETAKRYYSGEGRGAGVVKDLGEKFTAAGGTLMTGTPAKELVVKDGAVCGVVAQSADTRYTISAKAVILASGGYGANRDLLPQDVNFDNYVYAGHAGAQGDAIAMTKELNADLINMEMVNMQPIAIKLPSGNG